MSCVFKVDSHNNSKNFLDFCSLSGFSSETQHFIFSCVLGDVLGALTSGPLTLGESPTEEGVEPAVCDFLLSHGAVLMLSMLV